MSGVYGRWTTKGHGGRKDPTELSRFSKCGVVVVETTGETRALPLVYRRRRPILVGHTLRPLDTRPGLKR